MSAARSPSCRPATRSRSTSPPAASTCMSATRSLRAAARPGSRRRRTTCAATAPCSPPISDRPTKAATSTSSPARGRSPSRRFTDAQVSAKARPKLLKQGSLVLRSNPAMFDRIAQLGKGCFQLPIGRYRNLLRQHLDEIRPILVREEWLIGRQPVERALDHPENIRFGVTARFAHAPHETGIELAGVAFHLLMISDMDLISLVRLKG